MNAHSLWSRRVRGVLKFSSLALAHVFAAIGLAALFSTNVEANVEALWIAVACAGFSLSTAFFVLRAARQEKTGLRYFAKTSIFAFGALLIAPNRRE